MEGEVDSDHVLCGIEWLLAVRVWTFIVRSLLQELLGQVLQEIRIVRSVMRIELARRAEVGVHVDQQTTIHATRRHTPVHDLNSTTGFAVLSHAYMINSCTVRLRSMPLRCCLSSKISSVFKTLLLSSAEHTPLNPTTEMHLKLEAFFWRQVY